MQGTDLIATLLSRMNNINAKLVLLLGILVACLGLAGAIVLAQQIINPEPQPTVSPETVVAPDPTVVSGQNEAALQPLADEQLNRVHSDIINSDIIFSGNGNWMFPSPDKKLIAIRVDGGDAGAFTYTAIWPARSLLPFTPVVSKRGRLIARTHFYIFPESIIPPRLLTAGASTIWA